MSEHALVQQEGTHREAQGTQRPLGVARPLHPSDAPTTASHPPRCSYVLLVTVAPRLVLEPGPATCTSALPGRHRLRLRPQGLRARVLLRPLATQKATSLRGRRKGARGVDLAGEPLVQRSHGPPCAGSLVRMLREKKFLSLCLSFLSLPPPAEKREGGKRRRWGKKKGEPGRSAPLARRVAWVLSDSAWLSFSAPSPAAQKPGVGVIAFSFCFSFFFFFLSLRQGHVQPHQRGKQDTRSTPREGTLFGTT